MVTSPYLEPLTSQRYVRNIVRSGRETLGALSRDALAANHPTNAAGSIRVELLHQYRGFFNGVFFPRSCPVNAAN